MFTIVSALVLSVATAVNPWCIEWKGDPCGFTYTTCFYPPPGSTIPQSEAYLACLNAERPNLIDRFQPLVDAWCACGGNVECQDSIEWTLWWEYCQAKARIDDCFAQEKVTVAITVVEPPTFYAAAGLYLSGRWDSVDFNRWLDGYFSGGDPTLSFYNWSCPNVDSIRTYTVNCPCNGAPFVHSWEITLELPNFVCESGEAYDYQDPADNAAWCECAKKSWEWLTPWIINYQQAYCGCCQVPPGQGRDECFWYWSVQIVTAGWEAAEQVKACLCQNIK